MRVNEFLRSRTVTTRARVPSVPLKSPTTETRSPTTTDFLPNSRAFMAFTTNGSPLWLKDCDPVIKHLTRPRSTSIIRPVCAAE
ncbi:unannotated protein [freshwater metagenome]|uniref:Unannotated protein n=1 Tax=freshwater metagenome TaxID=449393 RepID=A0A6J6L8Z9_9ZZZZ